MTGVDRRAVIERRRSAVLGVNDRFHQEQTPENNRGMTGSRDNAAAEWPGTNVCLDETTVMVQRTS